MNNHASPIGASDLQFIVSARALAASGQAHALRVEARLTLRETADLVGAHFTSVHSWEQGRRRPRGPAAARYGRLLADLKQQTQP